MTGKKTKRNLKKGQNNKVSQNNIIDFFCLQIIEISIRKQCFFIIVPCKKNPGDRSYA